MNVGDVTNSSFSTSKHLKPHPIDPLGEKNSRTPSSPEKKEDNHEVQDSINISAEAREAHAAEQQKLQELDHAKQALDAVPELSLTRKQEILDRLNSGFYTQSEVLDQITSQVSKDLG